MTTIVIADDERELVEVTTNLLEMSGIDIVGVGFNGKQAVELCTKYNPNFLLLDLSMPSLTDFLP